MHVLVLRLSALGDVAMTIPAIYSVARTYPQHRFTVVTAAFTARLFVGAPENVHVLALEKSESRGIGGTFRLLRRLFRIDKGQNGGFGHVDAVADLHNVLRSWIVDAVFFLRWRRVALLDKRRSERRAILHDHSCSARPFTQRYFDVFAQLGLKAEPEFGRLEEIGEPTGFEIIGHPAVGIAPFARYRNKTYSIGLMQEVVRMLVERGAHVYLFGARGMEATTLEQWVQGDNKVTVVAGRLPLEHELALMARLDVMLTMDSANMHLASLVGTRVVSFWGGTTPACGFLGYGQSPKDTLLAGLSCQPCTIAGSDSCPLGHMHCTKGVKPEAIVQKLLN